MKPFVVLIAAATLTSGCTFMTVMEPVPPAGVVTPASDGFSAAEMSGTRTVVTNQIDAEVAPPVLVPQGNTFQTGFSHKTLSDYAEQITMQLMSKAKYLTPESQLGIASFVTLDSSLRRPTVLGNKIAESFISEVQAYGVSVVDHKVLPYIEVSQAGDFVFKRGVEAGMGPNSNMQYVLTGTLQQYERGVQVNARIVDLDSQVVIASAKGIIPHFVVSSLVPQYWVM